MLKKKRFNIKKQVKILSNSKINLLQKQIRKIKKNNEIMKVISLTKQGMEYEDILKELEKKK